MLPKSISLEIFHVNISMHLCDLYKYNTYVQNILKINLLYYQLWALPYKIAYIHIV